MWPSLWQVLQLYHWLNDRSASWKRISPFLASESVFGAAQRNRPDELGRLGVDDLHRVGQVVGDVQGLAVGGEGELGGPAAQGDAAEPAVVR